MANFTSNTYTLKREILSFSNKIARKISKPDRKFTADMTYGMLASQGCLLTDVVEKLHEYSKKFNSVERLARHLNTGIPRLAMLSYLRTVRKWIPHKPVIHIDDSDIVKPDGYKYEAFGLVRDGSKSTVTNNIYEKGYQVTEACAMKKTTIRSAFIPRSIFQKKRTSLPLTILLLKSWNVEKQCLAKLLLLWGTVMMIIKCS